MEREGPVIALLVLHLNSSGVYPIPFSPFLVSFCFQWVVRVPYWWDNMLESMILALYCDSELYYSIFSHQ